MIISLKLNVPFGDVELILRICLYKSHWYIIHFPRKYSKALEVFIVALRKFARLASVIITPLYMIICSSIGFLECVILKGVNKGFIFMHSWLYNCCFTFLWMLFSYLLDYKLPLSVLIMVSSLVGLWMKGLYTASPT